MKSKTFLILLVCVAVLAVAAFFTLRTSDRADGGRSIGKTMLADLPFDRIAAIRIDSGRETVAIEKAPQGWTVREKDGYPADFSKISELVEKLKRMKTGKRFAVDDDLRRRLSLHPPGADAVPEETTAVKLSLVDAENRSLVDLLIGSARQSGTGYGGQYLMRPGEETVVLVDQTFRFLDTAPADWLHRQVVDLDSESLRSVAYFGAGADKPTYRLERKTAGGPFALAAPGADGPLKADKAKQVAEALSPLQTEDVFAAEDPERSVSFEGADRFEYRTEDGRHYVLTLGPSFTRDDDTYTYARLHKEPTEAAGQEAKTSEKQTGASAAPAPDGELGRWIYVLSEWKTKAFVRDPSELVESEKEAAASPSQRRQ